MATTLHSDGTITTLGSSAADSLSGGTAADTLSAGDADDVITGGTGDDSIDGGSGTDTAVFSGSLSDYGLSVDLDTGDLLVSGPDGQDRLTDVETLQFGDTAYAVQVAGSEITLPSGPDDIARFTPDGSGLLDIGDDTSLFGGVGDEVLSGGADDDGLAGGAGADTLVGDGGDDTLQGGAGGDLLSGGAGNDSILGDGAGGSTDSVNLLVNGSFEDGAQGLGRVDGWEISGGPGGAFRSATRSTDGEDAFALGGWANAVGSNLSQDVSLQSGEAYTLTFDIGATTGGDDQVVRIEMLHADGTALSETMTIPKGAVESFKFSFVAPSDDMTVRFVHVDGESGDADLDNVVLRPVSDNNRDTIDAGAGDDFVDGGADNDSIEGGAGADTLRGGDNDDTLIGGADDDNLDGGAGSDTAVLSGNAADYAFSVNGAGALVVSGQDGTDTLSNIQTLQFDDTSGAVEYHPDGSVSISTGDAPATLYTSDGPVAHLIARETFDENNGSGWYTTAPNAEGNLTLYTAGGRTADGDRYFGNRMGDDGTEFVNKTYDLSGTSSDDTLIIEFDFYAFDTRDALSPDDLSDQMHIFVNGAELTAITPSTAGDNQSGTFNGGSWEIVRAQHDDNLGFGGGGDDVYQVRIVMDNPGDSVQLGFGGSVANSHHSEIWGIDNLTVATSDDPIFSFSQNDTDVTPVATAGAVVMGNHFDDSIVAAADASESVEGGDGNDTLRSSSGSDTLDGGAGDDVLNTRGGAQGDEARGGEGDDSIIGSVRDTLIGGDGDDTVVFQSWANDGSAFGEAGDDSILGNNGQQYISGGDGNDTISGGGEYDTHDSDTLVGGAGDDSISSGNTLTPRDGFAAFGDSLRGDEGDDTLIGGAAKDTLDGGADNDSLDAGAEDDLVRDGMGDDTVDGGTGDDSIIAGGGLDQYAGGSGEDLIDYSGTSTVLGDDGVRINLESQTVSGGEAADDTISGFEHATGSGSDDTILGSAGDNVLSGSAGNDSIYGGAGRDFLDGGTGQDTLVISDNDTAMGGEGDDTITTDAWAVNSRAFGGDGNDSMIGINGWNQVFFGEGGDDTLSGGQEAGTGDVTYLYGGDGNDLVSSGFTNATTGQMAKAGDHLTGDAGDDTLLGGAARDVLSGGADQDSIDGAQGNDTIDGGSGDDTITGGIGDDVIGGGAGADSIDAGDGDDRVYLGDGGDTVLGGAGNDLITGAQGAPVHGNSITFNSTGGEGLSTGYGVAGDMQDFPTTALTYEVTFSSEQEHAVLGSYQSDSDASNHMILMAHSSTNTFWGFINGEIVDTGVDTTPFFDGEIHTVGMSWDSATGDFQLYGDGAALFQGTVSAGTPLPADGTFVLGQEQDVEGGAFNTAEIFQGEVFGVRLYDDVRSPGEMAGSSLTPTAPADANLIANWVPDAGTEGMIDTTGNHPMALNGDVAFTDAAAQSGDDSINAGDGDDTIDGGTGDDVINAGEGDDYVYVTGDFGNDTVSLGTGQDTVDMSGVSDGVTVDYLGSGDFTFTDGQDTIALNDQSGQPVGTFILTDQEDIYDGGGGGTFHMGDGDDTITGGLHHGLTAYGEEGDDALTGNASGDMLDGGDGDDTLSGGFGADTLIGGTGDDSIAGGDGADFLKTGQGQDTLDGGAGADTLMNAAGDDSLVGGGGDDLIVATQGQDTLEGDAGSDTLMGGTDGDSIDGGADNDLILGDLAGVKFNETGTDGAAIASGISDFPSSQLTYEITFSSTDTTGETPLASYAAPGKDNEFLLNVQSGTLTIGLNDSAYADTGITSASLFDGSVKTLAVTWDNATGDLEIFVDGSPAYTGTLAQNETLTQGGSFALGQEQDSPGGSFDNVQVFEGTIYGVRLYNDIRTSSEILDSVHGPVADTSDPSLIANWVADADGPGFTDQTGSYTMAVAGDVVQDWSAGTDTIQGGAGDDTVYAGGGGDTISSGSGNDSVEGGDDADTFIIEDGFGNDTITGGEDGDNSDQDLIDLSGVTASGVTVNFSGDEAGTVTDGTDTIDFSEIEQISGTDQGDKIDAGNATSAVTLEGAGGNDVVLGGDGADSIDGGDGNDNLSGDAGADTIDGGAGFDYVNYGSTHSNDLSINLRTGANTDGDTYINLEGAQGGSGADTIIGTDGDESFLSGYSGADSIDAGDGDDLIWGDHNAFSTAGGGADTILAGSGKDTVFGHSGDDLIYGGEGDDSLSGGQGTDTIVLENASGSDTIIGGEDGDGSDIDVIDLSSITAGAVTVTYTGQEAGTIVVGSDTISFSEIEEIILTDHADVVDATGAALTSGINMDAQGGDDSVVGTDFGDTIAGGEGNDLIEGGLGDDLLTTGLGDDTLLGGEGNDTLMNSDGDDSLDGGAGDDSIVATGGEDTLRGGTGDDTMDGGDDADTFIIEDGFGNDVITGGEGTTDASDQDFDTIDLSAITSGPVTVTYTGAEAGTITDGTDTITFSEIERIITTDQADIVDASGQPGTTGIDVETGGGDDTVTGSNNADRVDAGDGNDSVTGGSGWDTLTGGAGNDTMTGDGGSDRLEGGTGDDSLDGGGNGDRLIGGEGNDTLAGGAGFDTLEGGADDDSLDGGSASDSLDGGDGADTLIGGTGDDTLEGGAGDDLLTGGDGDDTFIFNVGDGADTITDFNAGNTGALGDGDTTNNDFIDLGQFYSSMGELRADFDDDGLLNQSNDGVDGADYSDNTAMQSGDSLAFSGADRNSFSSDNTGVVCFAAGTLILTDRGEVPVERLRAGDRIATYDNGFQPLAMLASRRLGSDALAANPRLEPIEIKAGALGFERSLIVSPQHAMLVRHCGGEALVRARQLSRVKGGLVRVMKGCRLVTYVHLIFDAHQIVFANGRPAESFYPGPRALDALSKDARQEFMSLFPNVAAEVARTGAQAKFEAARKLMRSRELPSQVTTAGPAHSLGPLLS
ncbi:MAG: Hint domain-containing protein [Pseudomonadota bacterium]